MTATVGEYCTLRSKCYKKKENKNYRKGRLRNTVIILEERDSLKKMVGTYARIFVSCRITWELEKKGTGRWSVRFNLVWVSSKLSCRAENIKTLFVCLLHWLWNIKGIKRRVMRTNSPRHTRGTNPRKINAPSDRGNWKSSLMLVYKLFLENRFKGVPLSIGRFLFIHVFFGYMDFNILRNLRISQTSSL